MHFITAFILSGFLWLGSFNATAANSCENPEKLPGSMYDAIKTIRNTEFDFEQSIQTLKVFGVKKATFYSCDSNEGYLIVETNKRTELFRNVPYQLWNNFLSAGSIDGFYQVVLRNNSFYQY